MLYDDQHSKSSSHDAISAPSHKDETRERLLETARTEFRRRGFDTASIDTLMKAAGLTRGGFYAHFKSKEALVEEVLSVPSGLRSKLEREAGSDPEGRAAAADAFDVYLDSAERADRVLCPMVAHPMDALRGGDRRREIYGNEVQAFIDQLQEVLGPGDDATTEATLLATLSVGAAILGAAVGDDALATRIESAAAAEIRQRLGAADGES